MEHAREGATTGSDANGPAGPDVMSLLATFRQRRDVVMRLVDAFESSGSEDVDTIESAIDKGDAAALEAAAHRLKGSAAMLGATALATMASRMEAAGEQGRIDGADGIRERFISDIRSLRAQLHSLGQSSARTGRESDDHIDTGSKEAA
jgi:HPt (histidine-containing phosphotransfer) domain-containing protein